MIIMAHLLPYVIAVIFCKYLYSFIKPKDSDDYMYCCFLFLCFFLMASIIPIRSTYEINKPDAVFHDSQRVVVIFDNRAYISTNANIVNSSASLSDVRIKEKYKIFACGLHTSSYEDIEIIIDSSEEPERVYVEFNSSLRRDKLVKR